MSRVPSKHARDQAPEFEALLGNLQDWELSLKDKDKKLKSQSIGEEKLSGPGVNGRRPMEKAPSDDPGAARHYDYLKTYDPVGHLSSNFMTEEGSVDANSEKELGNEYFKQKNFNEAIDCYSRSIALSPSAVAYANRAMAYLKIKRFQEAENDCTEALNLDDRYIKAYSRRSTARKELGKLKESIEDAEFALRLEPHNQEIKKQYADVKSLYEKDLLNKASRASRGSVQGVQKGGLSVDIKNNVHLAQPISTSSQRGTIAEVSEDHIQGNSTQIPQGTAMEIDGKANGQHMNFSDRHAIQTSDMNTVKRSNKNGKQELKASVQELAARAASLAKAEAAKNIVPPNSAYQFEASWRGLSGDRSLQAHLLKVTAPTALPQIFKNALSAHILTEIVKCIGTFFCEDMDLSVKYLENLTKVPRFDMIILCLPSTDKADFLKIWNEVFCKATPEYAEILNNLRAKYIVRQ